eukprot:530945-Pelagomonas_calceolata.AAC.1
MASMWVSLARNMAAIGCLFQYMGSMAAVGRKASTWVCLACNMATKGLGQTHRSTLQAAWQESYEGNQGMTSNIAAGQRIPIEIRFLPFTWLRRRQSTHRSKQCARKHFARDMALPVHLQPAKHLQKDEVGPACFLHLLPKTLHTLLHGIRIKPGAHEKGVKKTHTFSASSSSLHQSSERDVLTQSTARLPGQIAAKTRVKA